MKRALLAFALAASLALPGGAEEPRPPGGDKSAATEVLEAGAVALQDTAPVDQLSIWLVGFHPLKEDPSHQMQAHHFCRQVNEDFAQCVLFDGGERDAKLNGVEYIISERLFDQLPEGERRYWHPHNYEILSGQLVAPGLPEAAERRLMQKKVNSYGKTWHFWMDGDPLPFGTPQLAWSFNDDGALRPELLQRRDEKLGIDSSERRQSRRGLAAGAHPQCGVDVLPTAKGAASVEGVEPRRDGCPP